MLKFVTKTMTRRIGWLTFWLAVVSVVLGMIGFARVLAEPASLADLLYRSLTILRLGVLDTRDDPFLEIGRWTGVLFLFSALVTFLVPRLEFAWRRLRMRIARDHTVLFGDGPAARAFLAAAARGETVSMSTQAELDPYDLVSAPKARLPMVLTGDATQRSHLLDLAVHEARRAMVVTGDDARNLEITQAVIALAGRRHAKAPLAILTHLGELNLIDGLIEALPRDERVRLRPFSLARLAARAITTRHPFIMQGWYGRVAEPAWLFVGFDAYAEALLLLGLRMRPAFEGGGLRVTVVADDAQALHQDLLRRYPTAHEVFARVRFVAPDAPGCPGADLPGEAGDAGADRPCLEAALAQTAIFVFGPTDLEAFKRAKQMRLWTRVAQDWRVPMFVRLSDGPNWRAALRPLAPSRRADEVIEAFGSRLDLCTDEGLRDWQEALAERVHDAYVKEFGDASARGAYAFDNTLGWSMLSEQFREANRRAVDHYLVKLALLGFEVPAGPPRLSAAPRFGPVTLERIARFEHASWSADKLLAGWSHGLIRDDSRLRHDCLVPFEALGAERKKDVAQFEAIGRLLVGPDSGRARDGILPGRRLAIVLGPGASRAAADRVMDALLAVRDAVGRAGETAEAAPEHWRVFIHLAEPQAIELLGILLAALPGLASGSRRIGRVDTVFVHQTHAPGFAALPDPARRAIVGRLDTMLGQSPALAARLDVPALNPDAVEPEGDWAGVSRVVQSFCERQCEIVVRVGDAAPDAAGGVGAADEAGVPGSVAEAVRENGGDGPSRPVVQWVLP